MSRGCASRIGIHFFARDRARSRLGEAPLRSRRVSGACANVSLAVSRLAKNRVASSTARVVYATTGRLSLSSRFSRARRFLSSSDVLTDGSTLRERHPQRVTSGCARHGLVERSRDDLSLVFQAQPVEIDGGPLTRTVRFGCFVGSRIASTRAATPDVDVEMLPPAAVLPGQERARFGPRLSSVPFRGSSRVWRRCGHPVQARVTYEYFSPPS